MAAPQVRGYCFELEFFDFLGAQHQDRKRITSPLPRGCSATECAWPSSNCVYYNPAPRISAFAERENGTRTRDVQLGRLSSTN